ncbi:hypothetical protein CSHISOI_01206, partial [Colletotrichum shisoi]
MGLRQNPIPRAKGILGRLWPRVPGRPRLGVMEQPRTKQFVIFSVEGKPDTPKCMTITFWPIHKQVPMRVNESMLIWKRLFKTRYVNPSVSSFSHQHLPRPHFPWRNPFVSKAPLPQQVALLPLYHTLGTFRTATLRVFNPCSRSKHIAIK